MPRIAWSKLLTALPFAVIVVICSALPLGWMLAVVIANPAVRHELSLTAFRAALLGRTLGYNAAGAVIATAMGLPAAFVLGRGRGWFARIAWVILPAALLMPSLAYAYGWSQVVRIIRPWVRPLGVTFEPTGPADVLRCIWSLAAWLWAVPAGLIGLSLRRLDTAVQQQALLDGALRRVTLRQLAGPIVASLAIVTILATQEFAVYEPTGISVIATEVRMVFDTGALSSPQNSIAAPGYTGAGARSPDQAGRAAAAVATAAPLIGVTMVLAIAAAWGATRTSAAEAVAGADDWPPALDAGRWTIAATVMLLCLNVGLPVAALIGSLRSFSVSRMYGEFGPQLGGAMLVATEAAVVAVIVALSAAGQWVRGGLVVCGASFLLGGQLLAIALIRIFNRPALGLEDWAYNTSVAAVVAYLGRFGWLAVAAGRSTWSRPWRELRDVAAVDGASAGRAARAVVWPLGWPMLLAGGLLVGALSLTEVPATVLLMPQNPQVLTPTLMTWVHMARYDPMIEASLLMMAAVLAPALAAVTLTAVGLRLRREWVIRRASA